MNKENRYEHWRSVIDDQVESGLSAAAYCRKRHLNLGRFYWWRRRLKNDLPAVPSTRFVELIQSSGSLKSGVLIRLQNALVIEVERNFDPFTLRTVIETLNIDSSSCLP